VIVDAVEEVGELGGLRVEVVHLRALGEGHGEGEDLTAGMGSIGGCPIGRNTGRSSGRISGASKPANVGECPRVRSNAVF